MVLLKNTFQTILTISLVLTALCTKAQHKSIMLGTGISTISGDYNIDYTDPKAYGFNIVSRYVHPLENNRWNLTAEINFSRINPYYEYSSTSIYDTKLTQFYMGVGSRYYIFKTITKYNPFPGEFLPFVELTAGFSTNSVKFEEPLDISLNTFEGTTVLPTGVLTFGFLVVLNDKFSLEGYGGFRYNANDKMDGLYGSGAFGDTHANLGIGLHMTL